MVNRICVGVASSDYVRTQTVGTLLNLLKSDPTMEFCIEQGPYVHRNREEIIVKALNKGYFTHLFFVDSDMAFHSSVLQKLLSHDKDIVGAMYSRRMNKKNVPVVTTRFEGSSKMPPKIFVNNAAGTGCLLIKMDVFKNIPQPWFFFGKENDQLGEDIYFCHKAREAGYQIWIDPTLDVQHVGEYNYLWNIDEYNK